MQGALRMQRAFLICVICMSCAWSVFTPVAVVASQVVGASSGSMKLNSA